MDIDPSPIENALNDNDVTTNDSTPLRFSRVSHPHKRYGFFHKGEMFIHEGIDHIDHPTTYEEAISNIDSSKWLEAMKAEMNSMYKNGV